MNTFHSASLSFGRELLAGAALRFVEPPSDGLRENTPALFHVNNLSCGL